MMRTLGAGALFLLSLPLLAATTYYVSPSGSDGNNCKSADSPCATIRAASLRAVLPGDVVEVAPGVYNERLTIRTGGTEEAPITYRGHSGSGCPVVRNTDLNSRGERPAPSAEMLGFSIEASNLRFECFLVKGYQAGETNSAFAIKPKINNITILDNVVDGMDKAGIPWAGVSLKSAVGLPDMASNIFISRNYVVGTSYGFMIYCKENCVIEDNEVERLRAGDNDYSRIFGEYIAFRRNYFHGNRMDECGGCHSDCFQTYNIGGIDNVARHVVIDSNTCFEAHQGILARDTKSINPEQFDSHSDWLVKNKVFGFGPEGSVMSWCAMFEHIGSVTFIHNLCYGGANTAYSAGTVSRHAYNIHYKGSWKPYTGAVNGWAPASSVSADSNMLLRDSGYYTPSQWAGTDVVNVNPLFVDEARRNFRLMSTSPARNKAYGSTEAWDHTGSDRPGNSTPSIGPYEVQSDTTSDDKPATGNAKNNSVKQQLQQYRAAAAPASSYQQNTYVAPKRQQIKPVVIPKVR